MLHIPVLELWNVITRYSVLLRFPTLPEACDHNKRKNSLVWPDYVPFVLGYFLAAIPTVSVLRINAHAYY